MANVSVESELGTIGTTGNSIEGGTEGVIYTVPSEANNLLKIQELIPLQLQSEQLMVFIRKI